MKPVSKIISFIFTAVQLVAATAILIAGCVLLVFAWKTPTTEINEQGDWKIANTRYLFSQVLEKSRQGSCDMQEAIEQQTISMDHGFKSSPLSMSKEQLKRAILKLVTPEILEYRGKIVSNICATLGGVDKNLDKVLHKVARIGSIVVGAIVVYLAVAAAGIALLGIVGAVREQAWLLWAHAAGALCEGFLCMVFAPLPAAAAIALQVSIDDDSHHETVQPIFNVSIVIALLMLLIAVALLVSAGACLYFAMLLVQAPAASEQPPSAEKAPLVFRQAK